MITKSDWQSAYDDLIADGRKRLGPPPTVEEIEALFSGELSGTEAERVRELLAHYPELARVMTEPFPEDNDGVLSDQEIAADLAAIRQRTRVILPPPPIVPFTPRQLPSRALAIAAGIVVVLALGGIYLKSRPQGGPRQVVTRALDADGQKGGMAITRGAPVTPTQTPIQLTTANDYLLKPLFRPEKPYARYRLELVDLSAASPRAVWTNTRVQRQPDGSYPAELAAGDLAPGLYELVLYGDDGGESTRLATYTIRFSAP